MKKLLEHDLDYLAGILDHCDRIESAMKRFGDSLEAFLEDCDYRDSVMMNIFQIGEAVNHLSDDFKKTIVDIPWHKIYGIRNVIAHSYIEVDDEIMWRTAKEDIPELKKRIISHVGEL